MIDYSMDITKYIVFFGIVNVIIFISIYLYNKGENSSRLYSGLAVIYAIIQIGYRLFLYYFKSYGIIGSFSKISIAHLYYNNLFVLAISIVLCFLLTYFILNLSRKIKGNINYLGILLILIGFYSGIL